MRRLLLLAFMTLGLGLGPTAGPVQATETAADPGADSPLAMLPLTGGRLVPVPEPTGALLFAIGLTVAYGALHKTRVGVSRDVRRDASSDGAS